MTREVVIAAAAVVVLAGCSGDWPSSTAEAQASPKTSDKMSASSALDRLDERKPVPLLPMMAQHQKANMRDHLVAVQEIVAGLASKNYAAVEKAAKRIGFSEQMGQMCTHMGAGAPGFTEQALAFHHTADGIVRAAQAKHAEKVLKELNATLQTCTACHAAWKQQVVDEGTWQRITPTTPPMSGH
jgi:hypothetical protein